MQWLPLLLASLNQQLQLLLLRSRMLLLRRPMLLPPAVSVLRCAMRSQLLRVPALQRRLPQLILQPYLLLLMPSSLILRLRLRLRLREQRRMRALSLRCNGSSKPKPLDGQSSEPR